MKRRFNFAKMRREFYSWHGGQDSPLYAAASSGLVADTLALQTELREFAESVWGNTANFKGGPARAYAEAKYLRAVADSLSDMLSAPGVASDGRTYRCLPWADKSTVDFMHPDIHYAAKPEGDQS